LPGNFTPTPKLWEFYPDPEAAKPELRLIVQ